jgi:uncharacterized cupredoxin-like copper-binding protein
MAWLSFAAVAMVAVSAVVLGRSEPAASEARATVPTVVNVVAGKPTEWRFTLSRASGIPAGEVFFKVTNKGTLPHLFKVCSAPVANVRLNACAGKATAIIKPGRSATLTVKLSRAGTYEFLCTSGAAKGMKGLITVTAKAPARTATTPQPSTTSPSPTAATPSVPGDASSGKALFQSLGCASCHSLGDVQAFNSIGPDLNQTHPLNFPEGPLTQSQLSALIAYVSGSQ